MAAVNMFNEFVISSAKSNATYNFAVWDAITGKTICTFKEGNSNARSMSLVGSNNIIAGLQDKPIIKLWTLNKFSREEKKFVCSGIVTALAVTPSGFHAVGAMNCKIHVWEVFSGNLMAVLEGHYQDITTLKFTDGGEVFISGSKDATALVWELPEVIQKGNNAVLKPKPLFVWNDHSRDITDIHVGAFGYCTRVITVSLDGTARLYDLSTGKLIYSLYADVGLYSATMDSAEEWMHVGAENGNIYQIELFSCVRNSSADLTDDSNKKVVLARHTKVVRCLSTSLDGSLLLSGSDDGIVYVWKILTRTIQFTCKHQSPVTNAFFAIAPPTMLSNEKIEPSVVIKHFKRNFAEPTEHREIEIKLEPRVFPPLQSHDDPVLKKVAIEGTNKAGTVSKKKTEEKCNNMEQINNHMYMYSINSLLNSFD